MFTRDPLLLLRRGLTSAGFLAALLGLSSPPPSTDRSLPPIVFVSRQPVPDPEGGLAPGAVPGVGPRDRTVAVGGRLLVLEPDRTVRELIGPPTLFDIADPCVSWDGKWILVSGLVHRDSSWRIYEIGADGTGLRPVTRSDRDLSLEQFGAAAARFSRYDDIDPCWLPDGRICFASTRYPMVAEDGVHLATNLFVVERDGGHLHRITTERNGGEEPAIDPVTGRIVYSRWWMNLDRPSDSHPTGITYLDQEAITHDIGNFWQSLSVTPDGRGARLHGGDPRSRLGLHAYKPTPLPDGRLLALLGPNASFAPSPAGTGLRLFPPGAGPGRPVAGWRPDGEIGTTFRSPASEVTVADDVGDGVRPAPLADMIHLPGPPWATDPVPLPGGRIALAYTPSGGQDFGLYACRLDGSGLELLWDRPGSHELDPAVLAPRPVPPVLKDQVDHDTAELPPTEDPASFLSGGSFRFDCLNVFANAAVDAPIPDAPKIARDVRFRLFINFQRQNPVGRDPSILFRETEVSARGAITEQGIPAEVPLFGHLLDAHGRILRSPDGAPAHVAGYGSGRHNGWAQCVGCHVGHSLIPIAHNFSSAEWFNVSTSARVEASSDWVPPTGSTALSSTPVGSPGSREGGRRVVDRRARDGGLDAAWIAAGRRGESVTLRWQLPIEVRRFVLYGVTPDPVGGTDLTVEDCRITMWRSGKRVARPVRTGPIEPDGTEVNIAPVTIDSAQIEILASSGRVKGEPRTGLAEIETIARLTLE